MVPDNEYDFSHLSEADRATLMGELVKLRDRRNGWDPESVMRRKLEDAEKELENHRAETAHWKRKFYKLLNEGE